MATFGSMADYPYLVARCLIAQCVPNISMTRSPNDLMLVFHTRLLAETPAAWLIALPDFVDVREKYVGVYLPWMHH